MTLHNDGKVTVKRMDSKFDMMLDRYFDETDSDSDTETKTRSEESPVFSWGKFKYFHLKGIYPEFQVIRGFSQKIPAGLLSYDQIHS